MTLAEEARALDAHALAQEFRDAAFNAQGAKKRRLTARSVKRRRRRSSTVTPSGEAALRFSKGSRRRRVGKGKVRRSRP